MALLGRAGVDEDSSVFALVWIRPVSVAPKTTDIHRRRLANVIAASLTALSLGAFAEQAAGVECKPRHFRPPFFVKTMGPCEFDLANLSFRGEPAEQARCLMRGMDASRNLGPTPQSLPDALANRVGGEAGLPGRDALAAFLATQDLQSDFAAYLWTPVSRANDDDPDAPMARYFVIHDTSGPNYGRRPFPTNINGDTNLNNLADFKCDDGWGKAHVVVNRVGEMLIDHELSIPWRETRFEQAANFSGALKGLFLHVELIQPRRSAGRGSRNDAQTPDPAFTTAQYDRLALVYVIASVRAGRWLIPAFHAALDADIPNGHDDPLNFDVESFANSLNRLVAKLAPSAPGTVGAPATASEMQAAHQ
jgi:hypothetical protein